MAASVTDDALEIFLAQQRARPWCWRTANCALWVADWVEVATNIDPARAMRGRAGDAEQWKQVLHLEGGFMPIVGAAMDGAGFKRTQSPARGDVGIVTAPVGLCDRLPVVGAIAAICIAPAAGLRAVWPLFVVRALRGLHYQRFSLVTAWRIECKTQS